MKTLAPKPFTFEAKEGDRAVLLLHGFTGNTADVRMLGRYLQQKGYTCHAPLYKGHDLPPEQLLEYGPGDWWQDVIEGYEFLKDQGYKNIAVCGLSLGGVFSLKLGYTVPIKGIIPMCAPMSFKSDKRMLKGLHLYAAEYKRKEGKSKEQIEKEIDELFSQPLHALKGLKELIVDVKNHVDLIYAPTFVVQARNDQMIDIHSANIIYDAIQSDLKKIKWYEDSGHVITVDKERDQLHVDIFEFLEKLDWEL